MEGLQKAIGLRMSTVVSGGRKDKGMGGQRAVGNGWLGTGWQHILCWTGQGQGQRRRREWSQRSGQVQQAGPKGLGTVGRTTRRTFPGSLGEGGFSPGNRGSLQGHACTRRWGRPLSILLERVETGEAVKEGPARSRGRHPCPALRPLASGRSAISL